jgi:hypothetical protein
VSTDPLEHWSRDLLIQALVNSENAASVNLRSALRLAGQLERLADEYRTLRQRQPGRIGAQSNHENKVERLAKVAAWTAQGVPPKEQAARLGKMNVGTIYRYQRELRDTS